MSSGTSFEHLFRSFWIRKSRLFAVIIAAAATLLSVSVAFAAVFDVDTTTDSNAAAFQVCSAAPNDCSLRGAITKANLTTAADTINVPAGTYALTLTTPTNDDNNAAGDLDIRNGNLNIVGAGAATTIVQAATNNRVFDINNNGNSTLTVNISGLTIQNGNAPTTGSNDGGGGGGIRVDRTVLGLTNDIITANRANEGGGVWIQDDRSNVTLTGTTVSKNTSTGSGGGIHIEDDGQLTITGSSVIGAPTSANGNTAASGGGGIRMRDRSRVTVNNSTVTNNSATNGGGGIRAQDDSRLTVNAASIISSNTTAADGGGILMEDNAAGTIDNSTVSTNTTTNANDGGGIAMLDDGEQLTVQNNTQIINNTSADDGGGIYVSGRGSTVTIQSNSNVSSNHANGGTGNGRGGGISLRDGCPSLTVSASSVNNNTASSTSANGQGMGGGIYADDGACGGTTSVTISGASSVNGNTAIGGTANNSDGGIGGGIHIEGNDTQLMISGNSTVNGNVANRSGTATGNGSGGGGGIDADGFGTVRLDGAIVDSNHAATGAGTTCAGTPTALGGGIRLQNGGSLTITGGTQVTNNVACSGGGGISQEGGAQLRITSTNAAAILISGNTTNTGNGGGIRQVATNSLTIDSNGNQNVHDTEITGNRATAGSGGGIYIAGTTGGFGANSPTDNIAYSTISGNTAGSGGGGGIFLTNGSNNHTSLTVNNTTISGNTATGANGGGILQAARNATVSLSEMTISGNTAGALGGGYYRQDNNVGSGTSSLSFQSVTVAHNTAATGGGLNLNGAGTGFGSNAIRFTSTLIADNTAGTDADCTFGSGYTSNGFNLVTVAAGNCLSTFGVGTDQKNVASGLDPVLSNGGGSTLTHALLPGSNAIDKGSDASATDQRGTGFPRTFGTRPDVGAYESQHNRNLLVNGAGNGSGTMTAVQPTGGSGPINCAWNGTATSGTCSQANNADTAVFVITAAPNVGSVFTGWANCDSTSGTPDPVTGAPTVCTVRTNINRTVTATFYRSFLLTVNGADDGTGTMTASAPTGTASANNINCAWDGTATSGTCTATGLNPASPGVTSVFVLTATPDVGSSFTGWTGQCTSTSGPVDPITGANTVCSVTMNAAKAVTGHFQKNHVLTVVGAGTGGGNMLAPKPVGAPGGINCDYNNGGPNVLCSETAIDTSTFVLKATPDATSSFTGWDNCDSTSAPNDPLTGAPTVCTVTVSSSRTVTGNFSKKFGLTVLGAGDGTGTMVAPAPTGVLGNINCAWNGTATSGTCTATGLDSSTFVITATPDAGSAFTGWDNCDTTSGPTDPTTGADTVCNVTTNAAKTVTGHFTKRFDLTVTGSGDGTGTMVAPAPVGVLGNINCAWDGNATSGTCTATGLDTSEFIITATPDAGSAFNGWTGCDTTDGPTDPVTGANTVCHVTTNAPKTVDGSFIKKFGLTVTGSGDGTGTMVAPVPAGVLGNINCAWDGNATSGTCTATGLDTTTFVITATPDAGSAFDGWTGCDSTGGATDPVTGADTVCTVKTDSAKTVDGKFIKKFDLLVDGAGTGSGTMVAPVPAGVLGNINCTYNGTTTGTCTATGLDTTTYVITATPDAGSAFTGWTGCDTTSGPTDPTTGADTVCNVTTNAAKTVTGHFTKRFDLTVTGSGDGTGTMVAPAPVGVLGNINCAWDGTATSGTCTATGLDTSEFIITATPDAGSAFNGWTGCDTTDGPTDPVTGANTVCHVTTNAPKTVDGSFIKKFGLTVTGSGDGTGTMVAPVPAGVLGNINCAWDGNATSGTCTATGLDTTTFVITATPDAGSAFDGWTGCDSTGGATDPVTGADTVCTVKTDSAKTVDGKFIKKFDLLVDGAGTGSGTMVAPVPAGVLGNINCTYNGTTTGTCSATGLDTTTYVITATPDAGSAFTGWTGCDTTSGPTDPTTGADTVCNVTTNAAKTVTGHFTKRFDLTVTGSGDGTGTMVAPAPVGVLGNINCAWDGTATSGTCTATGLDTSEFIITATPDAGSAFNGWTGCDTTDGPTDPVTGANTVCHVTTNAPKTVDGNFIKSFLLTVQGAGTGSGTMVAPVPAGVLGNINCIYNGAASTGACSATGLDTTTFVITATPAAGSSFSGWTGCDSTGGATDPVTGADTVCTVKTDSAKTVTGHFGKQFDLTVDGAGDGTGTMVAPVPAGVLDNINCAWNGTATTGTCTATGLDTTTFVITATADAGSSFTGWNNCDSTSGPTDPATGANRVCNVTTSSAKTVTANFSKSFLLTVKGSGNGSGNMSSPVQPDLAVRINCGWNGAANTGVCTSTGLDTSTFVITAAASVGSAFTGWTGCDSTGGATDPITGANTVCTVATTSAKTVTGNFVRVFLLTVRGAGSGTGTMDAPAPTGIVSGISCTSTAGVTTGDCTQAGFATSTYTITATPAVGTAFDGWQGCNSTGGATDPITGANTVCTVTTNTAKTVTGTFRLTHLLSVTGLGNGTGTMIAPQPVGAPGGIDCGWNGTATTGTACSRMAVDTSTFVITAAAAAGSSFTGWDNCNSTSGPTDPFSGANTVCNVTVSAAKTVTGHFEVTHTLTVLGSGDGSGTMTAPAPTGVAGGINCAWNGTATTGTCTRTAPDTATFIITATRAAGSAFTGWTGCDSTSGPTDPVTGANRTCTVTTSGDKTVTANFVKVFLLTVQGTGTGSGTMIAPAPTGIVSGISCTYNGAASTGDCTQEAFASSAFVITATPVAGTAFDGWTGCDSVDGATDPTTGAPTVCHVTTSSAKTVTGAFRLTHLLTVTGLGNGTGTMIAPKPAGSPTGIDCGWNGAATTGTICSQTAIDTTTFVITAAPAAGSAFTGWTSCDTTSGPADPITGANLVCNVKTDSAKTVTGHFEITHTLTVTGAGNGTGTMIAPPPSGVVGGIDCGWNGTTTTGTACKREVPDTTTFVITAAPAAGSSFTGWTGCDTTGGATDPVTGQNLVCTVAVSSSKTVTGSFTKAFTLTVQGIGTGNGTMNAPAPTGILSGIACTYNGTTNTGDCTQTALNTSAFVITAAPGVNSEFGGWTGCDSTSAPADPVTLQNLVCNVTTSAAKTVKAQFNFKPILTVAGAGGGNGTMTDTTPGGTINCTSTAGVTAGDCTQQASSKTAFVLTAVPAAGSAFVGWTGCKTTSGPTDPVTGANTTCNVTLNVDTTVTARFELAKTLTVAATGVGSGTMVGPVPTGVLGNINCTYNGTATAGTCAQTAPVTTVFTITATPAAGSTFVGWTGCDSTSAPTDPITGANRVCKVTLANDTTVTGNFTTVQVLTVKGAGAGGGTMVATGLINCAWNGTATSGSCVKSVALNTVVDITATPNANSEFVSWTGCDSTTGANNEVCHVTMSAAKTVTATFKLKPILTVKGAGRGQGTMTDTTPGGTINCATNAGVTSGDCTETAVTGTNFIITAAPSNVESVFVSWTGCDSTSGVNGEVCSVTLSASKTVTANFRSLCGILVNCSFESPSGSGKMPTGWTTLKMVKGDGTDTTTFESGVQSFLFTGATKVRTLRQVAAFTGKAKQKFTLNFWTKSQNASKPGMYRVQVTLLQGGRSVGRFYINLPFGTHDWKQFAMTFVAKKNFNKIQVDLIYGKRGSAWFDFLKLDQVP